MQLGSWARKNMTKERLSFVVGILSPFLVWGMLILWFHLTLQPH